jgi:hypothetical protein
MTATYTTPRTWSDGEIVTAAQLNSHLRDNLDYLKARPVIRVVDLDGTVSNTTSGSFVDVTGASGTITTSGSSRLIIFGHIMWGGGNAAALNIVIDGVSQGDATYGVMNQNTPSSGGVPPGTASPFSWVTAAAVADGSHTVKLQYKTQSATTLTVYGYVMTIAEVF